MVDGTTRGRAVLVAVWLAVSAWWWPGSAASDPGVDAAVERRLASSAAGKADFLWTQRYHWKMPLRWQYNHALAAPAWKERKYEFIRIADAAIRSWTRSCGIEATYVGETSKEVPALDRANVLGWVLFDEFGYSGEAFVHVGSHDGTVASLGITEADIAISTDGSGTYLSSQWMQALIAHEWGHAIGLAHSAKGVDAIMAPSVGTRYEPSDDDIDGCRALYGTALAQQPALPEPIALVEYYRPDRDHYFMTHAADEIAALDDGRIGGWVRTGFTIRAFPAPFGDTAASCRLYLPPAMGDSHFYGRDGAECTAAVAGLPGIVAESPAFFYAYLPEAGRCREQTAPIYRVWSNRPDVNHRYTMSRDERDRMVQQGWVAEGDGPDAITMCIP